MTVGAASTVSSRRQEALRALQANARTPVLVYVLTVMAVIGGFLFGYDTGVVSGAMIIVKNEWRDVNDWWQSLVVSVTVAAAAVFALISGWVNEVLGRRPGLIIGAILFIIGPIICGAAQNKETLVVGRVVVGMAIGFASASIPHYIAECSPPKNRGLMVTLFQLLITFGLLMASIIDAALNSLSPDISWRIMLGLPAIFGLIQLIGFMFMPESPRWLATHGKVKEAKKVLLKITSSSEIAELEFQDIMETHEESERERAAAGGHNLLATMFREPHIRRAMLMAGLLQMFQQLCGINTVMYYSTTIIIMSGIKDQSLALWLSCILSGVNFVLTFLGLYLIEKIGRKLLLQLSVALVTTCLVILGIAFTLIDNQASTIMSSETVGYDASVYKDTGCFSAPNCRECSYKEGCGFCYTEGANVGLCMKTDSIHSLESVSGSKCSRNYTNLLTGGHANSSFIFAPGYCPNSYAWLPILGMVAYLVSFSIGFGPVPWTLIAETFPNFCRSTGNAMATSVNWAFNLLISLTFLQLVNAISRKGAFLLYAAITFVGWMSFWILVPETKGKSLEELKDIFKHPWFPLKNPLREVFPCCFKKNIVRTTDMSIVNGYGAFETRDANALPTKNELAEDTHL